MATYKSPVELRGTINGMTFYVRNGVQCVRAASTFKRTRNDPRFVHVEQNNREFAGLIAMTNSFASVVAPVKDFADSTVRSRATSLFSGIKGLDSGPRGRRAVRPSIAKNFLVGFELNKSRTCGAPVSVMAHSNPARARKGATVNASVQIDRDRLPKCATHFRLTHMLGILSDLIFDEKENAYVLASPDVDGRTQVTQSAMVPLPGSGEARVTLKTVLPVMKVPASATVLEFLGVEVCEVRGDKHHSFVTGKTMKIIGAF